MPRVHEGTRNKKREIFSLLTPFQPSQGVFTFDNEQHEGTQQNEMGALHEQKPHVAGQLMRMGPSLLLASQKENMDIEVSEYEGGISQLTLEEGTQFYSGAVDDDVKMSDNKADTKSNNVIGDNNESQSSSFKQRESHIIMKDPKVKRKEMNDGLDDGSETIIGDEDDESSIDLLQEDDSPTKPSITQNDLDIARNGSISNSRFKNKIRELSPATKTLDRLDTFGSQRGGAELSLNLLSKAVNTQEKGDVGMDDDNLINTAKCASVKTKVETDNDEYGVVPFDLLCEAAERQSAVNDSELLNIVRGQPKGNKTIAHAEFSARSAKQELSTNEGNQVCVRREANISNDVLSKKDDCGSDLSTKEEINDDSMKPRNAQTQECYINEIQSVSADLAKRQCLHELKEYFMSTKNSSTYARKHRNSEAYPVPPQLLFCIACKNPATKLPHHGLCPKHNDFFNSGSYEILNLLVDGNLLKCEACTFHFENGRPNKLLEHIAGCEKGGKKRSNDKMSSTTSSYGRGQYGNQRVSLKEAAASGCKKCKSELATNTKTSCSHEERCPRKQDKKGKISTNDASAENNRRFPYHSVSLEEAADSGCNKCRTELATGVKTSQSHHLGCPRRRLNKRHSASLEDVTKGGKTFHRELAKGAKNNDSVHSQKSKSPILTEDTVSDVNPSKFDVGRDVFVESRSLSKGQSLVRPSDEADYSDDDVGKSSRKDDKVSLPKQDLNPVGMERKEPTYIHAFDDDANHDCLSSAEKKDEDGNPLSDYELFRLRNIKRNEARLKMLGLVKDKEKPNSTDKPRFKKENQKEGKTSAQRRNVPHRHKKNDRMDNVTAAKKSKNYMKDIPHSKKTKTCDTWKMDRKSFALSTSKPVTDEQGNLINADLLVRTTKSSSEKCTFQRQTDSNDSCHDHDTNCCLQKIIDKSYGHLSDKTTPPIGCIDEGAMKFFSRENNRIARSITPSPALLASRAPKPLPSFITDFIPQSLDNCNVPTLRGSKWLSCSNPWGKISFEENDIVIISPFQSENAHNLIATFHLGPNGSAPKRFAFKPMERNSPYLKSHRSPERGGYTVLRLTRDKSCLIPWGFTVRNHEFGGACLVDSVEPLSPAEKAEDISGWNNSEESMGIKVHDMIISINGKSVCGMTEAELLIELDICGPEVMLVLCRFDIIQEAVRLDGQEGNPLADIAMDWNDVGAVSQSFHTGDKARSRGAAIEDEQILARKQSTVQFPVQANATLIEQVPIQNQPAINTPVPAKATCASCPEYTMAKNNNHAAFSSKVKKAKQKSEGYGVANTVEQKTTKSYDTCITSDHSMLLKPSAYLHPKEYKALPRCRKQVDNHSEEEFKLSLGKKNNLAMTKNSTFKRDEEQSIQRDESYLDESDDDENPWLGCVCGKTHPPPIPVFWLQCETCEAWYNTSPECVGFDVTDAENMGAWSCWNCSPPIEGLEK